MSASSDVGGRGCARAVVRPATGMAKTRSRVTVHRTAVRPKASRGDGTHRARGSGTGTRLPASNLVRGAVRYNPTPNAGLYRRGRRVRFRTTCWHPLLPFTWTPIRLRAAAEPWSAARSGCARPSGFAADGARTGGRGARASPTCACPPPALPRASGPAGPSRRARRAGAGREVEISAHQGNHAPGTGSDPRRPTRA